MDNPVPPPSAPDPAPAPRTRPAADAAPDALDAIARRQTARFLDHLRANSLYSERLAVAVCRFVRYLIQDVRTAGVQTGNSTETANDRRSSPR